jgi:hypothetical protein
LEQIEETWFEANIHRIVGERPCCGAIRLLVLVGWFTEGFDSFNLNRKTHAGSALSVMSTSPECMVILEAGYRVGSGLEQR